MAAQVEIVLSARSLRVIRGESLRVRPRVDPRGGGGRQRGRDKQGSRKEVDTEDE